MLIQTIACNIGAMMLMKKQARIITHLDGSLIRRTQKVKWLLRVRNIKKTPTKILCYLSLKPRLQRLFMFSEMAEHMRWNAEGGNKDGIIRHPKD